MIYNNNEIVRIKGYRWLKVNAKLIDGFVEFGPAEFYYKHFFDVDLQPKPLIVIDTDEHLGLVRVLDQETKFSQWVPTKCIIRPRSMNNDTRK